MAWIHAIIHIVSLVVSYSMAPMPQAAPPAGFNELKVPTAEEGGEIPVLFGTRDLLAPNVVWYGDFSSTAIRKKGGKK